MIEFIKEYWGDILIALVAIYGAILSTVIFIKDQQKDKRRINIRLHSGFLTSDNGELSEPMLFFEIANPGFKKVTINTPSLRLKSGFSLIFPLRNSTVNFPYTLEEGRNITTWYELDKLKDDLIQKLNLHGIIKIKGVISDQVGNEFETKWRKLNLK